MDEVLNNQKTDQDTRHQKMLIDGKWVNSASGETFEVCSPANLSTIATVPRGRDEDVGASRYCCGACLPWMVSHRAASARPYTSADRG